MSVEKKKRNVTVAVIQCDREGCDATVAPDHEDLKGWFFLGSLQLMRQQGMGLNIAQDTKQICPSCAVAVKAAMTTSAVLTRDASPTQDKVCIGKDGRCAELAVPGGFLCEACGEAAKREDAEKERLKRGAEHYFPGSSYKTF